MVPGIEISDGVLINNLYRILYNELEFNDVFNTIGVGHMIEHNELVGIEDEIQEWLNGQQNGNDDRIKLIRCLEKFRRISDDENEFKNQLEVVKEMYVPLIKIIIPQPIQIFLLPLINDELINWLEETQERALKVKGFRRDNIIHQFRVFLLGCYILYHDKDFWIERFLSDIENAFQSRIWELFKQNYYIENFNFKYVLITWAIASLFHDFGKPIEDAAKEKADIKRTYRITNLPQSLTFKVPSLNADMDFSEEIKTLIDFLREYISNACRVIVQLLRRKAKKLKHGSVSAMLLIYAYNRIKEGISVPAPMLYFPLLLNSLIAISLHDDLKHFYFNSLTQLLIICDNLQEWNRITAIGDHKVRIFSCRRIYIKLEKVRREIKIDAVIPYERPEKVIAQALFRRFNPTERWEHDVKSFKKAKNAQNCLKNKRNRVELIVRILPNERGDVILIRIDPNKKVKYQINNHAEAAFALQT